MLCSNQQCSYTHWVHHANYKVNQNTKSQRPTNLPDHGKIFDKKDAIIGRILYEYRQKPPPTRSKKKKKHSDGQLVRPDRGVMGAKYTSQESILIPKDPTSPYAFTINVNSLQKRKKKHVIDQVTFGETFILDCGFGHPNDQISSVNDVRSLLIDSVGSDHPEIELLQELLKFKVLSSMQCLPFAWF